MAKKWHTSDWTVLRDRAKEFEADTDVLIKNGRRPGALQSGHIAIEVLMKAVISQKLGKHPHGHNLDLIAATDVHGWCIADELIKDPIMSQVFPDIASAWDMHQRYIRISRPDADLDSILEGYRRVFEWIYILIG